MRVPEAELASYEAIQQEILKEFSEAPLEDSADKAIHAGAVAALVLIAEIRRLHSVEVAAKDLVRLEQFKLKHARASKELLALAKALQ